MIDIVIADDHAYIRSGLIHILEKEADIRVIGEAGDGSGLLKELEKRNCDLVLMDISMPGMDVFDLIKSIRKGFPDLPVLILTMHREEQYEIRTIEAGASGYLTKNSKPEELLTAIRSIARGKTYISQKAANHILEKVNGGRPEAPHSMLTNREYEIFRLLAGGNTVSEIARRLNLSVKTISTHRAHILDKMDLKNNAQLTYYAIQKELI